MKKIYIIVIILIIALGCDNSLNPVGSFREELVFFSILKGDDSVQTAVLYKTVPPLDDGKPQNLEREFIKDALVRVWLNNDDVRVFKYSDGKYDAARVPEYAYYTENFVPEDGKSYYAEVTLKNGMKIFSTMSMPQVIDYSIEVDARTVPRGSKGAFQDTYKLEYTDKKDEGLFILNNMWLNYQVKIDNDTIVKKYRIPDSFSEKNGEFIPVFRKPSFKNQFILNTDVLTQCLRNVSALEPDDARFRVSGIIVEGIVYNKSLTAYYVSNNKLGESFSVSIDDFDYTNITNGYGLFGGYGVGKTSLIVVNEYLRDAKVPKLVFAFDY